MIYDLYVWIWYSNIVRIEGGKPPSPLKLCFISFFLLGCVNKTVLAHRDVHKPRKAIAAKSIPPGASFFTRVWKRQNSVIPPGVFAGHGADSTPNTSIYTGSCFKPISFNQPGFAPASVHRAFTSELLYQQVFPPTIWLLQQPPFAPTIFLD